MNRIHYAPFTADQVILLNQFQNTERPLLCAEHGWHGILVADRGGWHCPVIGCDFLQLWAPGVMMIPRPRATLHRKHGG